MSSIVVDAHYDLLLDVLRLRRKGETRVIERFFLDDLRAAGVNVLICSLFIPSEYIPEMALRVALNQIGNLHAEMRESPGLFALCRTAAEAKDAVRQGSLALFLSFEGVEPLGSDLQLLSVFHELGVRLVGLAWSRRNAAVDGCHFRALQEGTVGGLTAFGVALLREIERLGMILDVSHLNDVGFDDVLRFFKGPVIASHSNARSLCGVPRNLTDGQIVALASRGGVIGLNNMVHFVYPGEDDKPGAPEAVPPKLPPLPKGLPRWVGLLDHARHILEVAGEGAVGLGLDLCEFDLPEEARGKSVFPSYRHVVPFVDAVRREFSPGVADSLLGDNWMRVLETLK